MTLLQVAKGPNPGEQYTLDADRTVLGRHPDCDVVIDLAAVSRQHAQILRRGNDFFVEDLGSRNGTLVNGQQVHEPQQLAEGDRLKICDLDFIFYVNQPSEILAGPLIDGESTSISVVVEDEDAGRTGTSTVMSTFDVTTSSSGVFLSAKPEAKLKAIVEIGRNLGKALALDEVLPKVLDSLFRVFVQADRAFIVLRPSEDAPLVPKAIKHRRPGDAETVRLSRTIVNQAMTAKEAILSADVAADERFSMAQSIADFPIRSMMCAPLIDSDDRALGVLQIDTMDQRSRFTPDDLEVLASVASQAAVAIDNAQLHELALKQQKTQRDLELARRVQQGLLPSGPPEVEGYHFFDFYEAANEVGGDYYDYVPLPDGRVAVVVGDVSGKGVSAALLMAKLAGDVRFCLASETDLAAAVRRINQVFAASDWGDRFVTFVAAVLDPATHEVTLVNAGHMPPVLRHGGGGVEEIGEEEAGLPLGVADDYEYEACCRPLQAGDSLTLYTDGFSEAMNAESELYGLERIHERVAASAGNVEELGRQLLEDVHAFVGGQPQSDDMCVACFGRDDGRA